MFVVIKYIVTGFLNKLHFGSRNNWRTLQHFLFLKNMAILSATNFLLFCDLSYTPLPPDCNIPAANVVHS